MFIAPFTRLTTLDMSDAARLGRQEAERQAALLRVPGRGAGQEAARLAQLSPCDPVPAETAGYTPLR